MTTIADQILDLLNDDMVTHGLFAQCIAEAGGFDDRTRPNLSEVLKELLAGDVEVGRAVNAPGDRVEFVAWIGNVDDRVERALDAVNGATSFENEFAYWLCLRANIDRYEETS